MADAEDDVVMTPGAVAEQNQLHVRNFQGLSLSPSPWEDLPESRADDTVEKVRKTRRQELEDRQRAEREQAQREDAYGRRYRSYMAVLSTEARQARTQGADVDPDTMVSLLHMGMDAISGGGVGAVVHGIVAEDMTKGDTESQETRQGQDRRATSVNQPLREN